MIIGIGTDIVDVRRVEQAYQRYGDAYAHKLLTDTEWAHFTATKDKARYLAKRFAAKEAVVKALGTGFSKGITLKSLSIINTVTGKPQVVFNEDAKGFAELRALKCHISLSDEKEYALAFAVAEH